MNPIKAFYNRRNDRLKARGAQVRYDYDRPSEDYDWITINGVHTPIDDAGNISGGAGGKFNGKKYTGSKMQRSKKRQEKVGGGSFKLDKSKIKSKILADAVKKFEKENGRLPDQMDMHELAYLNFGIARNKARKIQSEYRSKYGLSSTNYAEHAEAMEERIKKAEENRDTFERDDPEWERWNTQVERGREHLQQYLDDPDYPKHKKEWDKVKSTVELIDSAREDAKAFLVNKGKNFKSAEEAGAWMEVSGWVKEPAEDKKYPKGYGATPTVSIRNMNRDFAVATAEAIGTFQKAFPKFSGVVSEIALRGMGFGDMGGYQPDIGSVEFASGYFSIDTIAHGRACYDHNVGEGHFPKNTTIDSVPYHEFTHAMEEEMYKFDFRKGKNILGDKRPADVVLDRVSRKLNLLPAETKKKVSKYAEREYWQRPEYVNTEFLAEALSEAYTSPTPRPVAVAAREEFEKLYHEVYD